MKKNEKKGQAISLLSRSRLDVSIGGGINSGSPLVGCICQQVNLAEEGLHGTRFEAVEPLTINDKELGEPGSNADEGVDDQEADYHYTTASPYPVPAPTHEPALEIDFLSKLVGLADHSGIVLQGLAITIWVVVDNCKMLAV